MKTGTQWMAWWKDTNGRAQELVDAIREEFAKEAAADWLETNK